ncbi:MAG: hypothetical protein ACK559_04645, partial [bacterium]
YLSTWLIIEVIIVVVGLFCLLPQLRIIAADVFFFLNLCVLFIGIESSSMIGYIMLLVVAEHHFLAV